MKDTTLISSPLLLPNAFGFAYGTGLPACCIASPEIPDLQCQRLSDHAGAHAAPRRDGRHGVYTWRSDRQASFSCDVCGRVEPYQVGNSGTFCQEHSFRPGGVQEPLPDHYRSLERLRHDLVGLGSTLHSCGARASGVAVELVTMALLPIEAVLRELGPVLSMAWMMRRETATKEEVLERDAKFAKDWRDIKP